MQNQLINLYNVFSSQIKSLEIIYTLEELKPCARILCNEDNLTPTLNFLKNNNLNYSLSDFKVLKQNSLSFYSDKSIKVNKDDSRKGHFLLYISKQKIAEKAKIAEEKNNHKELGLILGYPECCCEFFEKNFDENKTDLTLKTLENSEGFEFSFHTNIAARHFDINLLSHFPCSFNCKGSINIAKNNLELLKKISEEKAALFVKTLKSAVLYSDNGIFLLNNFEKKDNIISFKNIYNTINNELFDLLVKNKKVEIINKNKIKADNKILDDNICFMIFD